VAKTILIIDAERETVRFREHLEHREFRVITARTGEEGLAAIRRDPAIDLVVTEVQLADTEGLPFLSRLRAAAPDVPIIVVTGSGSIEHYLHAVTLGVYEYLVKPVPPGGLLRIAERALTLPRLLASGRYQHPDRGHTALPLETPPGEPYPPKIMV
jgi:DNA-binding NtrC family response regulator